MSQSFHQVLYVASYSNFAAVIFVPVAFLKCLFTLVSLYQNQKALQNLQFFFQVEFKVLIRTVQKDPAAVKFVAKMSIIKLFSHSYHQKAKIIAANFKHP